MQSMELWGASWGSLDLFYPNAWDIWRQMGQQTSRTMLQHGDEGPPAQNLVFHFPLARGMVVLIGTRSYRHPQHEPSSLNGCAGKSSVLPNQECNLGCADRKQSDHFGSHSWIWSSPSPSGRGFQHDAVTFPNVPGCGVPNLDLLLSPWTYFQMFSGK